MKSKIFFWTTFLIFLISFSPGCINNHDNLYQEKNDDNSNNKNETLINTTMLVLTISVNKTIYHKSNNCTIPVEVYLKNNDNKSYILDEMGIELGTLMINVTNSKGEKVTRFIGLVDMLPNRIVINPQSNISSHIIIGGRFYWMRTDSDSEVYYYFNTTGEFTFQAIYHGHVWEYGSYEVIQITSNQITIKIV